MYEGREVVKFIFRQSTPDSKREDSRYTKKHYNVRHIEENFLPLHYSFWLHGIGYSKCSRRVFTKSFFSVLFMILINAVCWYDVIVESFIIEHKNSELSKRAFIASFMHIFSLFTRVWLFRQRRKLIVIIRRVIKVYKLVSSVYLNFKQKLIILIFCNEVYITVLFILNIYATLEDAEMYEEKMMEYFLGYYAPPTLSYAYFTVIGIRTFSLHSVPALISFYFHFVSVILKKTFEAFGKRITHDEILDFDCFLNIHNKITDAVLVLNEFLHTPILLCFIYTLCSAFYSIFSVLFTGGQNYFGMIEKILTFLWSIFFFGLFCFSSSAVHNASNDVKQLVYKLPRGYSDSKKVAFVVKIQEKFVGFTLLQNIVIDKSLVLAALGTIFTYSIMFATFSVATKSSDE